MKNFNNEVRGEMNIISLPSIVHSRLAEEFTADSQSWLLLPCTEHVLDFNGVVNLDLGICPAVSGFGKVLRGNGKVLRSINVSPGLMKSLVSGGIEKILGLDMKPPQAQASAPGRIDVRFINPFLQATINIFELQTQTIFKPQKPRLQDASAAMNAGIIGIVALNGALFRGNIALCFPTDVFLKVYERMLGEKHSEITNETEDAAGELLNMIYGRAKTEWNKEGYEFTPAIPTVLRGEKISVRQQTGGPVILLPFESDLGSFHVEIATQAVTTTNPRSA